MTPAQKEALGRHWQKYGLEISQDIIDFDVVFGRHAARILEIGFGMGDSLLQMAAAHPDIDYIGIEVHQPGVGALFRGLEERDINNVKVFSEDALTILKQNIADNSLSKIHIYFPDPWPKKRHHKRRIIQPHTVELFVSKLMEGGELHLATDWQPYAEHMLEVLNAEPLLHNHEKNGDYFSAARSRRPETKFERRGRRLGHQVWDLLFIKRPI